MNTLAVLLALSIASTNPPPTEVQATCAPAVRSVLRDSRAAVDAANQRAESAIAHARRMERELAEADDAERTRTGWIIVGSIAGGFVVGALVVGLAMRYGD